MALKGYEAFHKLPPGTATLLQVVKSSCGVAGWSAFAHAMDVVSADGKSDHALLERQIAKDDVAVSGPAAQQRFLQDLSK